MVDLSQTVAPKSDQLNSDDLISGPRTITVTRVTAAQDTPDQPVAVYFEGDNGKPYKPCKSMRRVLISAWGVDASQFAGRSMTLYRDPSVTFGGMQVGGIRISHMTGLDKEMSLALTATKAKRAIYKVKPLASPSATTSQTDAPTIDAEAALVSAMSAAKNGTASFTAWWQSGEGKMLRDIVRPHMDELKKAAAAADAASAPEDDEVPL